MGGSLLVIVEIYFNFYSFFFPFSKDAIGLSEKRERKQTPGKSPFLYIYFFFSLCFFSFHAPCLHYFVVPCVPGCIAHLLGIAFKLRGVEHIKSGVGRVAGVPM